MANVSHGPYQSGSNQLSKQRAAEQLAESLSPSDFQALREEMLSDRMGETDDTGIPDTPEDIPHLRSIANLGMFVQPSVTARTHPALTLLL